MVTLTKAQLKMLDTFEADKGYWCLFCNRFLPRDEDGIIVHDDVDHPADLTFDEDTRPQ